MFSHMTDDQFTCWLAGFFDGEGCIHLPKIGIDVSIAGTERAVIEGIQRRLGVGVINETVYDRAEWKPKYHWRVRNYPDADRVLHMIRPYLTIKAKKADEALVRTGAWLSARGGMAARNARIVEMAEQGMMYKDIATEMGLDARTIGYIVRGIIRDGHHVRKVESVHELRRSHETQAHKSAGLGVTTKSKTHDVSPEELP